MKLLTVILITALVALQYRLWFGEGGLRQMDQTQGQIEQQALNNQRLYSRNAVLEAEVVELQQGLDTIEERARYDLGMIRQDEQFYFITK